MTETSQMRPRPTGDLRLHFLPDTNAGPNKVQELLTNYRQRQMKLPKSRGRFDVDSFQDPQNRGFVKYNGDTLAPGRDNVPIIDPTSGLVSVGGDVDRNTGVKMIPNLQQADSTPNIVTPYNPRPITTLEHRERGYIGRLNGSPLTQNARPRLLSSSLPASLPDPQLEKTTMSNELGTWNSRLISDALLRAKLGGWTSQQDPRVVKHERGKLNQRLESRQVKGTADAIDKVPDWKEKAALRYVYTSSTQRSYEDIDWDMKLPPKVLPPATTLERQADPVSHRYTDNKRYDPRAHYWQSLGRSWDSFQPRDGFHITGPIAFCSVNRRNDQIPCYDGFVGGIGERDHPQRIFLPSTVLRTSIPKYTDTAHRPNIPGYTGCTQVESNLPANVNVPVPAPQTTARTHRYFPLLPEGSPHKRTSQMSKMITLVPPCNPFNKVDPSLRPLEQYS
ncbi:protein SPMIP7-like [Apostichopus japonicus]|uniref:protein SPMIP7-like n=1 Tax=Stichopus japonicus TaxID=307972 RepID=UPI003AB3B59D